jgi:hypothetical protein
MMKRFSGMVIAILALASLGACGSSPAAPTSTATAGAETWSTTIFPGGAVSRTFTATTGGIVTVTLQQSDVPVGFGIGAPASIGAGCFVSSGRVDAQGATLSTPVEPGTYCVSVYDPGTLTAPAGLLVQIDHP